METLKSIFGIVWGIIQDVCVLYSFGTIVWLILPSYWHEKIKGKIRRFFRHVKLIDDSSYIKEHLLDSIDLIDGNFYDYGIKFNLDKTSARVPDDFKKIGKRLKKENDIRLKKGEKPVYTDLYPYAVHELITRREQIEPSGIERPVCHVLIRESSYFYSLISIKAMDEMVGEMTVREKYYKELMDHPSNASPSGYDIVHAFGMNTLVLTKDGSFVFSKRNPNTVSTGQGCLHLSVGEHLNKDLLDISDKGIPDAVQVMVRGIDEELGIERSKIDTSKIRFYGVAFSKRVCQYGVLGFTHLSNCTDNDIRQYWETSKDGHYENEELVFIKADIDSIVKFINNHKTVTMTKFALLNVCLALMNESILGEIKQERIEKELKKLRIDALL